ncbi:MAG: HAD hydrolase-like protein [Pseudomonadota bacterium]
MNDPWVFLDLDGTLTDAAPGITRSIEYALTELGVPSPGEAALRGFIGPALQETFPALGVAEVDRAIALYRERYTDVGLYENAVYEGAPEMMAALRAMGFRLALATAKPIAYAAKITAHFGLTPMMDAEFGSELDGKRTDKRDLLAFCIGRTGADPRRSFMLGDRMHDARGALANGLTPLGALWGFGTREELEEAGCAAIGAAPADIPVLVEDLK